MMHILIYFGKLIIAIGLSNIFTNTIVMFDP